MKLPLSIVFYLATISLFAQTPSSFYFTGYGRALIANDRYTEDSPFLQGDNSSKKRSLNGNFVFDLGINANPNEQFKASAILRVSNEFGGFFSQGSDLQFRQVQLQGILARKVLYNIGDIDLDLTKYTLYNNADPTYSQFEANAFKIKREISEYENFNNGNKWRVQGVQAGTKVLFNKYIQDITFNAFGARVRPSNFLDISDRLLFGASVKIQQSKYFQAGGNFISLSDIAGTVQDTVVFYKNSVATTDYKLSMTSRTMRFTAFGELGRSFYDFNKIDSAARVKKVDGFFDAGAGVAHKYIPFSATVSYRLVGPDFSSPGAQTRRVHDNMLPRLLPDGMNGAADRGQTIFDRASDFNLYNRSLSTILMYYNPIYNNATPYGMATPNRKGVTVDLNYGNKDSLIYANVNTQILSEVLGVGIKTKRKFMLVNAGATMNINRLIGLNRLMAISGGIRYEKTKGSEAMKVDFSSMMIDAGIAIETLKKLDLLGGIKMLSAEGTETTFIRNEFNDITSYSMFTADVSQSVYTAGFRYRFTNYIFFAANAFILKNQNNLNSNLDYQINQLFFSYIMRF
jgi:hypothetical protein